MGIAAMVIDTNTTLLSSSGGAKGRIETQPTSRKSAPEESISKATENSGGEVSLSSAAQSLSKLESAINSSPDVNSSKIEEIKKAIAEGSYSINAESIAQRMLDQDELFR